jgi:hypothetical protein
MAFQNMIQQMLGVPGMNRGLAATFINEAFTKIQNENVWSFQLITGGWLTPPLLEFHGPHGFPGYVPEPFPEHEHHQYGPSGRFLSPGRITVTPFTNTITGDAVATAAWTQTDPYPPLLTQQQIRVPYYSLYNIIALGNNGTVAYATVLTPGSGQTPGTYTLPVLDPAAGAGATISVTVNADGTVTIPPTVLTAGTGYTTPYITFSEGGTPATFSVTLIATLTIDRPWMEPQQFRSGYLVYQAYYPAPPGFKRWYQITDYTNNEIMDFWTFDQVSLAQEDPQRTEFTQPEYVIYYGQDQRSGSATIGQALYELWGHPLASLPYTFNCQCNWPALVNPTDTVPYPLTESILKFRTYQEIALWKESQRGDEMERGSGANWQFLWKAHQEEYKDELRQIRIMDRHLL